MDVVQTPQEESLDGDQLVFKAHIRGWETDVRRTRCQYLKGKSDLALRQALLKPEWKDILLIPESWYPAESPKFETAGWWYAPAEEVLGRTCKSCRTFYEIEDVADMSFLFNAGVFKKSTRIDPRARLKGRVTDNEFRSFVDSCLKANKSRGPDGYMNECVKTMSHAELEVLRAWANEILAVEKARVMTVEEMNGTISLLHKGGITDDKPQDWRPVVLLNCTNQLVMHILNARLRGIVEKAGILEPGQSGGRQGRSTDINLTKLEWVTREAVAQGKRVYRVDVDFCNAFNAMSQAALCAVMRA